MPVLVILNSKIVCIMLCTGVCKEEMTEMLRFMYTGKLHLTQDSIVPLLTCASLLKIHQAIDLCQEYLDTALDGLKDHTLYTQVCMYVYGFNLLFLLIV